MKTQLARHSVRHILQGYGLSETAGAATVTRFEDNKVVSVGTPLDGVEVRRVRDYIIRAEPLPRITTRKVKRFELKNQIEGSGEIAGATRQADRFVFSSADRELMNSPAGRAVTA